MIKINNIDEIYNMNIGELWNILEVADDEEKENYLEEIENVKNGIRLKLPIIYIINKWYVEYPENKRVSIKGYGKYDILVFFDEIQERCNIIRKIILELNEEDEPNKPRS